MCKAASAWKQEWLLSYIPPRPCIYLYVCSFIHFPFICLSHSSVASNSLWYHGTPGFPVHHQLLELAQTVHQVSDAIKSSHPLHPLFVLPSVFTSIKVFSNESVLRIRWPEYWSFSFSISLSNEYSALIPFRIDWFDLFAVQGTLKNLLQHQFKSIYVWQNHYNIVK